MEGGILFVLMIDFDNFKSFNDFYGYVMGDVCLKFIVEMLLKFICGGLDILVCYGGEEFIVLFVSGMLLDVMVVVECMCYFIEELDIFYGMLFYG